MATPKRKDSDAGDDFRRIPIELIDEPSIAIRETMEERELADLAIDIAEAGLINPLTVKPVGDRYEVIAGHRRLLACRLAEQKKVPCYVRRNGNVDPLSLLVAENELREEVNVIEQARFYQRLLTELCENDVDALCIKVRRRREYVEDRLCLLQGWPKVVEALHGKKISMAVARELNKIRHEGYMLQYLDTAVNQGATARQIAEWRRQSDGALPPDQPAASVEGAPADGAAPAYVHQMRCLFCDSTDHPHMMQLVYLHSPCKGIVESMLGRQLAPAREGN